MSEPASSQGEPTVVYPTRPAQPASAAEPPPGQLGDFQLLERLGQGGMGEVWRACEVPLEREVALKLLGPHVAADPEARQRFLREAQNMARLHHPRLVTCYRVGEAAGRVFMALELCPAGDLDRHLAQSGGRLPELRALELIRDCAEGLVALEAAGLVHRDIKPGNVFLGPDGRAKLGDLGLAREESGADRITRPGLVIGTPGYMSPEQASGDLQLDARADVWSLGATLFHLLAGRPPFTGTTAMSIVSQVLSAEAPEVGTLVPGISSGTCALLRRALARRREERFASAQELLAALERALRAARAAGELAAREPPRPAGRRIGAPTARDGSGAPAPAGRRGPSPGVLAFLLLALLLALGAVALERRRAALVRDEPDPPVGPATPTPVPAVERPWRPLPCRVGGREVEGLPAAAEGRLVLDPGQAPWGRAALFGQVEGPCELRWELDVAVERDAEPQEELRQQGFDAPGGFFCELGARSHEDELYEARELRGEAVWASLLFGREGGLLVLVRALNRAEPGPLRRGAPGLETVGTLAPGDFPLDRARPLEVRLVLDRQGWQLTVEQRGSRRADVGRAWGEGRSALSGDLARRAHVWTQLGNWAHGAGRGTVEVATRPGPE